MECFSCKGSGIKIRKNGLMNSCNSCKGQGIIMRSKRKDKLNNMYIKKKSMISYPSFKPSGPPTFGNENDVILMDDEELCYLTGNWRIIQRVDRHRYSTDDLVTSFVACNEFIKLSSDNRSPYMLDIGCGLGSVLMTCAWLLPKSKCIGIEFQRDRFELAQRSIEFNLGKFLIDQNQITVLNHDLRDDINFENHFKYSHANKFDVITATPPYFKPQIDGKPACIESAGCLFELRGGVEDYCLTASKFLRSRQSNVNFVLGEYPSIFVMCNTALSSTRVYDSCHEYGLSIVKRIDVIPKEDSRVLFCVFVIVLNEWTLFKDSIGNYIFPLLNPIYVNFRNSQRVINSVRGELIESICVRKADLSHTDEYCRILAALSKPSSKDKEIYDNELLV